MFAKCTVYTVVLYVCIHVANIRLISSVHGKITVITITIICMYLMAAGQVVNVWPSLHGFHNHFNDFVACMMLKNFPL